MSQSDDLTRLYDLMERLRRNLDGYRHLKDADSGRGIPRRGVYFFFDLEEPRSAGLGPRIVRVGTHAVAEGADTSTLRNRLVQHRGTLGGRHPGGGNHRGSVFRRHVGVALLARDGYRPAAIAATWGKGGSAPPDVLATERPLEYQVSAYIGRLAFLWVDIDDVPSKFSRRAIVEQTCIGLLSHPDMRAADPPGAEWLGHHADRDTIRSSGLWNVDHVGNPYDAAGLDVLTEAVTATHP